MAASGRNSVTTPLCACSIVAILLLLFALADVAAAAAAAGSDVSQQQRQETGVVASTEAFYLRGNPTIKAEIAATEEAEESYESFARRELVDDGYQESSANCSANCDEQP